MKRTSEDLGSLPSFESEYFDENLQNSTNLNILHDIHVYCTPDAYKVDVDHFSPDLIKYNDYSLPLNLLADKAKSEKAAPYIIRHLANLYKLGVNDKFLQVCLHYLYLDITSPHGSMDKNNLNLISNLLNKNTAAIIQIALAQGLYNELSALYCHLSKKLNSAYTSKFQIDLNVIGKLPNFTEWVMHDDCKILTVKPMANAIASHFLPFELESIVMNKVEYAYDRRYEIITSLSGYLCGKRHFQDLKPVVENWRTGLDVYAPGFAFVLAQEIQKALAFYKDIIGFIFASKSQEWRSYLEVIMPIVWKHELAELGLFTAQDLIYIVFSTTFLEKASQIRIVEKTEFEKDIALQTHFVALLTQKAHANAKTM